MDKGRIEKPQNMIEDNTTQIDAKKNEDSEQTQICVLASLFPPAFTAYGPFGIFNGSLFSFLWQNAFLYALRLCHFIAVLLLCRHHLFCVSH